MAQSREDQFVVLFKIRLDNAMTDDALSLVTFLDVWKAF